MRAIAGAIVILAASIVFFAATILEAATASAGARTTHEYEYFLVVLGVLASVGLAVFGGYLTVTDGRPARGPVENEIERQITDAIRADAGKNRAP